MASLPAVIPKTRTVTLGGDKFGRQTLSAEIQAQSTADVQNIMRAITAAETASQIRQGNPPSVVEIDNQTNKRLEDIKRKAVVLYGVLLAGVAMRAAEQELRANIDRSTSRHTGRLSNVSATWQWRFIPKGGAARIVSTAGQLPAFGPGDKLVLVPAGVPHATITNRNVANSGRLNVKPGKTKRAKAVQNLGFLGMTARKLRSRPEFKQFAVIAEFTKGHAVGGEIMSRTQGTGVITIRPRFRRGR